MGSTFQADATAAIAPLLNEYQLSSCMLTPANQASFTVAAPIAISPAAPGFALGFNIAGAWASNCSLQDTGLNIAQYLVDLAKVGPGQYVRMFDTSNNVQPPTNTSVAQALAKAGQRVIATYNLQNSPTRCKVPSVSQIKAFFAGLATSAASGIWGWELINEHDSEEYCTDTPQNVAMLFSTAGPILKSKGYAVIGSNAVNSLGMYSNSTVANVLKASVTHIGRHGYAQHAADALGDYAKVKALADSMGLGFCCTEVGLMAGATPAEGQKLWAGVKALGGIYCGFTFYQFYESATAYPVYPFISPGSANPSMLAAIKAGLGT